MYIIAANHSRPLAPFTVLDVLTDKVSFHQRVIASHVYFAGSKRELKDGHGGRSIVAHAVSIETVPEGQPLPPPVEIDLEWIRLVYRVGDFWWSANPGRKFPRNVAFERLILTENKHIYVEL